MLAFAGIVLHRRVRMFTLHAAGRARDAAAAVERRRSCSACACLAGADFPGYRYFVGSLIGGALWPLISVLLKLPQRPRPTRIMSELDDQSRRRDARLRSASSTTSGCASAIASAVRARHVRPAVRALRLPAGRAARSLPHAGRGQPHRDRADRAEPRPHRRPQRRRAGAQLLRLHARDHAVQSRRPRGTIDELADAGRDHAARPQALQASCWRRARASSACRSAPGSPTRKSRASPPSATASPASTIKARLFRQYPQGELASHVIGYIGRINQTRSRTASTSEGRDANYRGTDYIGKLGVEQSYETRAARHDRLRGGRSRRRRPRRAHAVAHAADPRQQPGAVARHRAAGGGRGGVRRPARRAGRDRARDRRRARLRLQARLRSRTCSSTASTRRTGRRSTNRPTSRCSTARCAAPIRRARPSSRSWRWPR